MCPLRYIYLVLLFLLTNLLIVSASEWKAFFDPNPISVKTAQKQRVHLVLAGLPEDFVNDIRVNNTDQQYIQLVSEDESLASVRHQNKMAIFPLNNTAVDTNFDVHGEFLGMLTNLCTLISIK